MIRDNLNRAFNSDRVARWQSTRADFLKSLFFLGVSGSLFGCEFKVEAEVEDAEITSLMSNRQAKIILVVQNILFPEDGNGPSAKEINAFPYLLWYLQDELIEKYERDFYLRGADWVEQESRKLFDQSFLELPIEIQAKLISILSKKKRIKQWLSKLLTYIFEALLSDPIYGGNCNKIGWKWLDYDSGEPRPSESLKYPFIINRLD